MHTIFLGSIDRHKVGTYHDMKMKGVEFLRNIYAASGLSIDREGDRLIDRERRGILGGPPQPRGLSEMTLRTHD